MLHAWFNTFFVEDVDMLPEGCMMWSEGAGLHHMDKASSLQQNSSPRLNEVYRSLSVSGAHSDSGRSLTDTRPLGDDGPSNSRLLPTQHGDKLPHNSPSAGDFHGSTLLVNNGDKRKIECLTLRLDKNSLDRANKDKQHKLFAANFKVVLNQK